MRQATLGASKWVLLKKDKMDIIKKIENERKKLGELCDIGQGVVPGRKAEFRINASQEAKDGMGYITNESSKYIEVIDRKTNTKHRLEKKYIKPLIVNSNIHMYILDDSNDLLIYTIPLQEERDDPKKYSGLINYLKVYETELKDRYDYDGLKYPWYGYQRIQNVDIFENNKIKIICPYRATENRFALDQEGYYGTTDMYAIVLKKDINLSLLYLLGLLNSKLLTFWYKNAGKSKGLILEFFANHLERMPIYEGSKPEKIKIEDLVNEIIQNKSLFQQYRIIWRQISRQFKNGTITFKTFLLNDKEKIQKGEFKKTLVNGISNYPDEEDEIITKKFSEIRPKLDKDRSLKLYGINECLEELLFEIEFHSSEYRDLIYLELLELLDSAKKINTLEDVFKKLEISIIKPNIWEKTHNLVKFCNKQFKNSLSDEYNSLKEEEFIIFQEKSEFIMDQLDAYIFKLYGLDEDDIRIILENLQTPETSQLNVLNYYNSI